jgi:murein DD-endopeptidase MepM/ murein hydrolase activator NlpD
LSLADDSWVQKGMTLRINEGGATQEEVAVTGLGSIDITPLIFDHDSGESVENVPFSRAEFLSWPLSSGMTVAEGATNLNFKDPNWYGNSSHTYNGHCGHDLGFDNGDPNSGDDYWYPGVSILAAAPGTVVDYRNDAEDQCDSRIPGDAVHGHQGSKCSMGDGHPADFAGNYVIIEHDTTAGYKYTQYAHMRKGTVPDFADKEFVNTGTFLGEMASSGNSSGPHLHFEVLTGLDLPLGTGSRACVDPYFSEGGQGSNTAESLWEDQCGLPIYDFYTNDGPPACATTTTSAPSTTAPPPTTTTTPGPATTPVPLTTTTTPQYQGDAPAEPPTSVRYNQYSKRR